MFDGDDDGGDDIQAQPCQTYGTRRHFLYASCIASIKYFKNFEQYFFEIS